MLIIEIDKEQGLLYAVGVTFLTDSAIIELKEKIDQWKCWKKLHLVCFAVVEILGK